MERTRKSMERMEIMERTEIRIVILKEMMIMIMMMDLMMIVMMMDLMMDLTLMNRTRKDQIFLLRLALKSPLLRILPSSKNSSKGSRS